MLTWKKKVGLVVLLGVLAGCSSTEQWKKNANEEQSRYTPDLHYHRYPIVVESRRGGKLQARVAPCGDFSRDLSKTEDNLKSPNFGCAQQHNIAAMVSNPKDFLNPRAQSPVDATRRVKVIADYREPKPTVTPSSGENEKVVISAAVK